MCAECEEMGGFVTGVCDGIRSVRDERDVTWDLGPGNGLLTEYDRQADFNELDNLADSVQLDNNRSYWAGWARAIVGDGPPEHGLGILGWEESKAICDSGTHGFLQACRELGNGDTYYAGLVSDILERRALGRIASMANPNRILFNITAT